MNHVLNGWRIDAIEHKAERAHSRLHELDALRRDVDRLEHSNRELGTVVDRLRAEFAACQEKAERLIAKMDELNAAPETGR